MGKSHNLEDKYTAETGSVFMTGTQALVRLPMAQMRRDRAEGLNTAAFVTGYRGSPLGAYDQQLERAKSHLEALDVRFQPGINEDMAATAIWGTQQVPLSRQANRDGVVGYWYGKGPGVDRCGDVFKHGNAAGSSAHGGVLCLAGDDHSAKSSTLPHQSDHAFMAAVMPVLYPSSIHEFIEVGLFGIAMSRYSGCWVGYKVISDTVETSAVVSLGEERKPFVIPEDFEMPAGGLNIRWPDPPLIQDDRLQEHKAYAALAFARANKIDQVVMDSPDARFGIVATGKAFEDVRQALTELGIDEAAARDIGLRLYKVRMPWPLEPTGIREFSEGLEEVLIIEERREIIENQIKQQLFNWRADVRPRIVGKFDEQDRHFLPLSVALSTSRVARAIANRVLRLPLDESLKRRIEERLAYLQRRADERAAHVAPIERQPWFCSGCPHNTSTKVPEGSRAMAGIGCHYMVQWMDRDTDTFTQMGGEGVPWTSISHYTNERHRFVNLGDGTYFHSGLLAIRASQAAGVNITYKILYNDAVAMTGGQTVDGELSAQLIAQQLHAEGVSPIYVVSDDPEQFSAGELPPGTLIRHRDEMDAVQRTLRELPGCNAIVFAQTCAAEKRRRRKRGLMVDPARRVVINSDVCEGCGDCSEQSNCVSIEPLETAMGRKRRINQSSCNKDFSCLKGFCPSFVSVEGGQLRKKTKVQEDTPAPELPLPSVPAMSDTPWNIAVTGVGGTGVLTIGALLGMAAHIDGNASMILDMAGLAQKGGAVLSHVRLARKPSMVTSPHIVAGGADLLIAADAVVAASKDGIVLCNPERTATVLNTSTAPVASFVKHGDIDFKYSEVESRVARDSKSSVHFHRFGAAAEERIGDAIATNIMMLGYAWQSGLVPIGFEALDKAIELNGVAVKANRAAFHWGRRLALEPSLFSGKVGQEAESTHSEELREVVTLDGLVAQRMRHLTDYQDAELAQRYEERVNRFRQRCEELGVEERLPRMVATEYARLLAYKDEYEVARLYSLPSFREQLEDTFEGDYTIRLHLAPPVLGGKPVDGRPRKRAFGPWILSVLNLLQKGKRFRGTKMDIFGRTEERRLEREWIRRYEEDMDLVLQRLDGSNVERAMLLLSVPSSIRGYGVVKQEAMHKAESIRETALLKFTSEEQAAQPRAA
ncbi:indolepyruvate ferredoxin oxidoreductase family protein [Granulosicoccus sp. 3-233]|uniref:indolepyruvate ferredoxin oxidoreductase family protein n=1 Tax=Granulosicoccus sp. 3-233 TaxID=3417969 RepID=UPI003D35184E